MEELIYFPITWFVRNNGIVFSLKIARKQLYVNITKKLGGDHEKTRNTYCKTSLGFHSFGQYYEFYKIVGTV